VSLLPAERNCNTMEPCDVKSVMVLDRAGICASLACAVHCAVFPLMLAALPALGLAWLDAEWVDWSMLLLAAGIALRAHRDGFTVHRRCLPAGVAVVGLLTIVTTMCLLKGNAGHHYMQASGAVVVTSAHFLNRHLCRTCTVC
jgi:MerC mercury resistance protein